MGAKSQNTVNDVVNSRFEHFVKSGQIRYSDPCPICNNHMMVFVDREKNRDRSLPACAACGYKVSRSGATTEDLTENWEFKARKQKMIAYFKNSSEVSDKQLFGKSFSNFNAKNGAQREALNLAKRVVKDVVNGEPVHAIFSGATGTGKSHLAMGVLDSVLKQTGYRKKVLFIDYLELLRHLKIGFKDDYEFRIYNQRLLGEVNEADIVVIDDLGAEAGVSTANILPSRYNLEIVTGIFQARTNKSTIITTNLSGSSLSRMYGARVMSRIMNHLSGHVYRFDGMTDYRVKK